MRWFQALSSSFLEVITAYSVFSDTLGAVCKYDIFLSDIDDHLKCRIFTFPSQGCVIGPHLFHLPKPLRLK